MMLYLHIPFCASKCHYCDFYSVDLRGVDRVAIVDKMVAEIESSAHGLSDPVSSVYFGGGTPSLLEIALVERLLDASRSNFELDPHCEITFEANPEQLTTSYLDSLRCLGVNRLSVGVQSFDDRRLAAIGRRHSARRAIDAIVDARRAGFDNISIDLIFGFSDMDSREWSAQVERALLLEVEHLSAYQLSIEPGTLFARRSVECASDEDSVAQYRILQQLCADAGVEQYEISNFARKGFRSRHNSGYWGGVPYIGIGASAHSFDGDGRRSWNPSSVRSYLSGVDCQHELLSTIDTHNEFLMTRLRTVEGFLLDQYLGRFGGDTTRVLEQFVEAGLRVEQGRVFIDSLDFFICDAIIVSLFRD